MILPHCTWDKFGELLADSGARSLGLFDELMSFFSTMNMYSSHKLQISDTREYQDFLQLFTGKAKTRATVTGNANFKMDRTSFSFLGFTQPYTALPVIQDTSNNAKGFTSRILWYFPQPVFAKFEDTLLTSDEKDVVDAFKEQFVEFLADLYINGESTFEIEEQSTSKMKTVTVTRNVYTLAKEAIAEFKTIHDEWELDVCERNPYDALIGGLYSRGKSHVLRLSVPIQLLLSAFSNFTQMESDTSQPGSQVNPDAVADESQHSHEHKDTDEHDSDDDTTDDENEERSQLSSQPSLQISPRAIAIAHSLVKTSLSQICTLNDKRHLLQQAQQEDSNDLPEIILNSPPDGMNKVFCAILSSPGEIVSFSILLNKGLFRRHTVNTYTGKRLMVRAADEMSLLQLGQVVTFTIPGNNSKVYFFCKQHPPSDTAEKLTLAKNLANIGMSLPKYIEAFETQDVESDRHKEEYTNRRNSTPQSSSTQRKRQRMELDKELQ